ncbi:VWA domain-containing protein [Terriglobus aquaticus]|uniref:VWA domain-containing protein n=1 Tax=Terriglobus aquaticus TaxID=940139 RepID=A0ABW9KH41_9BACT|nr:VWA domain-containing protein [Terriglobus aquaticus]
MLVAGMVAGQGAHAQALPDGPAPQAAGAANQAVPDSPTPQTLPDARSVAPGKGSSASTDVAVGPAGDADPNAPAATLQNSPASSALQQNDPQANVAPDVQPTLGAGGRVEDIPLIRARTNFVEIPFTVKDKHGSLVPGLTWRDVQVYENGVRKHISLFSSDPYPLSVAFVIDQSLPFEVMKQVNYSLGAVQGAFSAYDEVAVFTYANGVSRRTEFTGAQSPRLAAVLEQSKSSGREMNYVTDGPLSQNVSINNGAQANLNPLGNATHGSRPTGIENNPVREAHPLYDAVFAAAQELAKTDPRKKRRILYVVSDGRESGSKIREKELVRYLQGHQIAVYGTVVGDSATPYVGFLDKYHIPFTHLRDNALPRLAALTGGESISEFRVKGIEQSFARIGDDVRLSYTIGYYSNENLADGKYRSVEVRVLKPDLDVIAKKGYYPTPSALTPTSNSTKVTMGSPTPAATPQ